MREYPPRFVPLLFALPMAATGGFLLDLATPAVAWWPAAFIGAMLIMGALWQRRAWSALLLGLVAGATFWLPHISWLTLYLGPVPWLGLSAVMIVWVGVFGVCCAVATRGLARLPVPNGAVIALQGATVAGLWVLREGVQISWPYGGFAWGRLAHTQAQGPLMPLVSWLGFAGLTAVIALACALVVAAIFSVLRLGGEGEQTLRSRLRVPVIFGASTVLALVGLSVVPPAALPSHGTITVAAVQGNSKSGIFDDRENGDVFRAHLNETERMIAALERDQIQVDVIVWPENSAEFNLPANTLRTSAIMNLSERAGAPILVGTVLKNPDGTFTNSSLVYDAFGPTGARYDKMNPVPFAEYMPDRAFFRALAPDLVDLVQLEYVPGVLPAALPIADFWAGAAICFDIVIDAHSRQMVGAGAEVIFAQTNNADFGTTDENVQQLQIARMRGVETGRALVNISTVATSAIIDPQGNDLATIEPHTAGWMMAEVPLVSGVTPATAWGGWIAGAFMVLGALGLTFGVSISGISGSAVRRTDRRPSESPPV